MKKSLLFLKLFTVILAITLTASVANGQTNTWDGSMNNNWNTAANWSLNAVPTNAHDVVIDINAAISVNTGTLTVNSLTINNNAVVSLTASGGDRSISIDNNGSSIALGSTLTLIGSSGNFMAVTFAGGGTRTMTIDGTLVLSATGDDGVYNASNSATTVNGIIRNQSATAITSTATNLTFGSGSNYEHEINGGTVPTATWNAASNCRIEGMTANFPGGMGQSFGNLILASALTGNISIGSNISCTDLTISNTGSPNALRGTNSATGRTITVTGSFSMTSGDFVMTSDDGDVTLDITGGFSVSGGTFDFNDDNGTGDATVTIGGDFTHTAGTITRSDVSGTGTAGITFDGSSAQIFTSGGTVGTGVNYTVNNNAILEVAAAGTVISGNAFTLANGGTLRIKSTAGITSSGATGNVQTTTRTFNTGANYVYNGSAAQATGSGLPSSISRLTIDNAAGLTMTNPVTLTNASVNPLVLTNGDITGTGTIITISSAYIGGGGGGSASSHVNGIMAKTGTTTYEFPIGNGTVYRPVAIAAQSGSATVTARYFQSNPHTLSTSYQSPIVQISACEYWTLDDGPANITSVVTLGFGSSCNATSYVGDPAGLRMAFLNGGTWLDRGNLAASMTSLQASSSAALGTSTFTIGTMLNNNNPLPVKFSNIKASEKTGGVQIDWTSYQEENLLNYVIERSANGVSFTTIGTVSARNIAGTNQYGFLDATPLPGVSFYRLRYLDTDGRNGLSNIVKVNLDKSDNSITLYPNPVNSGYVSFQSSNLQKGNYSVKLITVSGQQIYTQMINHTGGAINQTIQLPAGTRSGMYNMQIERDGEKVISRTFMVQ